MDINNTLGVFDPDTITESQLCSTFDHTLLAAFAQREGFERLCREASDNGFAMVAVNSGQTALCRELLAGSSVRVGAAIGFPLGQTTTDVKVLETERAIADGAGEIDYVIDVGKVKDGDFASVQAEMERIVGVCRPHGVLSKVIFENCYLERSEIVRLAEIARQVRPDFIKTSTGFGPSGATVEDVRRMKATVGADVKVKAAGGIRTWERCAAMLGAGAERIGTSSALRILDEFRTQRGKQ
ncbi:deoxyribose-phosphate aldolase [Xylanimonas allomyrinae]|uniref:Deoxyribose-phosphate aldolase n=1 Tax=Xylanimonas allomyrinae TaxID=2509459 RepID=A0A4P6EKA5_9MICO|nr:deoxyribose-phosphate aldolase [Xylanimonas allomyrinae]QAY63120.1 deoxyribose-phosphate aldolase [Xylanimonas allomyrinae]